MKNVQSENSKDILGVPLQCFMLAMVNKIYADRIVRSFKTAGINKFVIVTHKSVFKLYESRVDASLQNAIHTQEIIQSKDTQKGILNLYTYKALEILFPDISEVYCKSLNVDLSASEVVV